MVMHACVPSYSGGTGRGITILGHPWQKRETIPEKQTKSKRAEGMAPVVQGLPEKY
jgi:hypothetical protein